MTESTISRQLRYNYERMRSYQGNFVASYSTTNYFYRVGNVVDFAEVIILEETVKIAYHSHKPFHEDDIFTREDLLSLEWLVNY